MYVCIMPVTYIRIYIHVMLYVPCFTYEGGGLLKKMATVQLILETKHTKIVLLYVNF